MDAKRTGVRGCMRSCATTLFFSSHDRRLAVLRSAASYTAGDHRVKIAILMTSNNDIIIIVTATVTTTVRVACSNPDILRNLIIMSTRMVLIPCGSRESEEQLIPCGAGERESADTVWTGERV
jgi:hypothetical protein